MICRVERDSADMRGNAPSRWRYLRNVGDYVPVVGAGIGLTPAFVVGLFGFLALVGFVNEDGPSGFLLFASIFSWAGLYAGFIALRKSAKTGVVVFFLVAGGLGVVIGALFYARGSLTDHIACPAVGAHERCPDAALLAVPVDLDAKPEEVRDIAYKTCAAYSVEAFARALGTEATARAVARGYAREFGARSGIYEGCLQGFRSQRSPRSSDGSSVPGGGISSTPGP